MTVAEIQRYVEGAKYRMKVQAQFDYTLGNLIGISVGRCVSKDATYPPIETVYPSLFEAPSQEELEQKEEQQNITNSTNRFMEFAMKHNARFRKDKEV